MHFLGKNIRYLRKQSGETQTGMGSLFEKGQTTIGNWENGISEPNIEELLTLSKYFGISIDKLIKEDLAQTNWKMEKQPDNKKGKGKKEPADYIHGDEMESIAAEPQEESLSYVIQKIKSLEQEISQLKNKQPK